MSCSRCAGDLAEATGVCVACGYDELGYYDDMPDLAFWSLVQFAGKDEGPSGLGSQRD